MYITQLWSRWLYDRITVIQIILSQFQMWDELSHYLHFTSEIIMITLVSVKPGKFTNLFSQIMFLEELLEAIKGGKCTRTNDTDRFFLCFFLKMGTVSIKTRKFFFIFLIQWLSLLTVFLQINETACEVNQEKLIDLIDKNNIQKYIGPDSDACIKKARK